MTISVADPVVSRLPAIAAPAPCRLCHGLGFLVIAKREGDGVVWYRTIDCPMCGKSRVDQHGEGGTE
jgi:hypothetical protein